MNCKEDWAEFKKKSNLVEAPTLQKCDNCNNIAQYWFEETNSYSCNNCLSRFVNDFAIVEPEGFKIEEKNEQL